MTPKVEGSSRVQTKEPPAQNSVPAALLPQYRSGILNWARQSAVRIGGAKTGRSIADLEALGEMIGDAPIVALSEAVHLAAEPHEFRNELLQFLVEKKGFTAVAIESGLVESRRVYDYARGAEGKLDTVMEQGLSWTFHELPQNKTLVRWLRDINSHPQRSRKINFYGFDVAGSPGNPAALSGPSTALLEALRYLERVDREAAHVLRARVEPLIQSLQFDLHRTANIPAYDRLSQGERDTLTGAVADLIGLFERKEAQYIGASSAIDFEWAQRAALGARQVDNWLRQVPLHWKPSADPVQYPSEEATFFSICTNVRDRAQADNLDWIVRQEGPAGKLLIYASRYHLSASPVGRTWLNHRQPVAGTYLRRRYGSRFLNIGNLLGHGGAAGNVHSKRKLDKAVPESVDGLAAEIGVESFLLDLRRAPLDVARWLEQESQIGQGNEAMKVSLRNAYDVLFYTHSVTPACAD